MESQDTCIIFKTNILNLMVYPKNTLILIQIVPFIDILQIYTNKLPPMTTTTFLFQQHLTVTQGENKHAIQRSQRWYDATERARGYTMVSLGRPLFIVFLDIVLIKLNEIV